MMPADTSDSLSPRSFAERTHEVTVGPCRLIVLPVPVDDVVSFAGSVRTSPDLQTGEDVLQQLVALTLDKGTKKRDRFAVADLIDNRGAQVQFRSSPQRLTFSGRALRADLADVLSLVAEQLREPLFDPLEVDKARARQAAELRRAMENTGARATGMLSRMIYSPGHPNHVRPPEDAMALVDAADVEAVTSFYTRRIGADELTLVVVGDVDASDVESIVERCFASWHAVGNALPIFPSASSGARQIQRDDLPAKKNVDVRLGHAVDVLRSDHDYLPLHLAVFILGGNFSARLMNIVRDRMGLTYGISAALAGTSVDYPGHVRVAVTLSPSNLARGVDATLEVVRDYVAAGASDDEVASARETIRGSFVVDLATTGGLAYSLLVNHLRGFGTGYLDTFRDEVGAVSTEAVNEALTRHIDPERLHAAYSGALETAESHVHH